VTRTGPAAQPGGPSGPFGRPGHGEPPAASRYYGQDLDAGAEPGYSMLAVSDPAADVTSTQTWEAVGDGRATGTWTAPARPDAEPGRAGGLPPGLEHERTADRQRDPGRREDRPGLAAPTIAAARAATTSRPGDAAARSASVESRAGDRTSEAGRRGTRGHSGSHTSPRRLDPPIRPDDPRRAATGRPRRKHLANVKVAIAAALVLVLAAAAALSYAVLHGSGTPRAAGRGPSKPPASPTPTASPSLGAQSRATDPKPLTVAELYPTTFTVAGSTVLRTASDLSSHCGTRLVGSAIQVGISRAGCTQVVRATYLASTPGLMGTIGVLNLSTANAAATAARSAGGNDFISQLGAKHGPTHRIGQGTGIEEAVAKGHYLILIWAEFTSLRNPKTAGQRTTIEQFMTELLDNTANVAVSNRMASVTP
jgi:hypothetical protein